VKSVLIIAAIVLACPAAASEALVCPSDSWGIGVWYDPFKKASTVDCMVPGHRDYPRIEIPAKCHAVATGGEMIQYIGVPFGAQNMGLCSGSPQLGKCHAECDD
jgi:hypothetical protein